MRHSCLTVCYGLLATVSLHLSAVLGVDSNMETYITLLVLSLASSELKCQVIVSNVQGPAEISNLESNLTNATSYVNLGNDNEEDQSLISEDSKTFGTHSGPSNTFIDFKTANRVNYHEPPFFMDNDDNDYNKYKINSQGAEFMDNYKLYKKVYDTGPAIISNPKIIAPITNDQMTSRQHNDYPTDEGDYTYVGPQGILIHKTHNKRYNSKNGKYDPATEETIKVGPAGIFIEKVQFGADAINKGGMNNYFPVKKETTKVGPNGILIHKRERSAGRGSTVSSTNVHN